MGETQDKVDKLLSQFEGLDLNQKLYFLYSELLNERHYAALHHEYLEENIQLDDFDYAVIEQEQREMRIVSTQFTDKELLFLSWATGMWDGMTRNGVTLRLGMIVLALICDKRNPQVYQNIISRTRGSGAIDQDWMLNDRQEAELFAKLQNINYPSRISPLVKYLNEWLMKRRRTM